MWIIDYFLLFLHLFWNEVIQECNLWYVYQVHFWKEFEDRKNSDDNSGIHGSFRSPDEAVKCLDPSSSSVRQNHEQVIQLNPRRPYHGLIALLHIWRCFFFVTSLPDPESDAIRLRNVEGGTAAVVKFSGRPSEELVAQKEKALRSSLMKDGLKPRSGYLLARYNDPRTKSFVMVR